MPVRIAVVDAYLVVLDRDADTVGLVLDRLNGLTLGRFGSRRVIGPGSLDGPVAVDPDRRSKRAFWVIDEGARRITRFIISPTSGQKVTIAHDSVVSFPRETPRPVIAGFRDATGAFVLSGFFPGARFGKIVGERWVASGPPPPGPRDIPAEHRQQAYQTAIVPHPSHDRFVAATVMSDRLEVYRSDAFLEAAIPRWRGFEPTYRTLLRSPSARAEWLQHRRYGYLSIAATEQGFFALYSGRTNGETPGIATAGSLLEYFDWRGVQQWAFGLDQDVATIAATPSGDTVYAISYQPVPTVVRFVIPVLHHASPMKDVTH